MPNAAGLVIQLAEISPATLRARAVLDRLCARHDLTPFVATERIRIAGDASPRSHPVLTLGTGSADDPDLFLAEFLHLQMQWRLAARETALTQAVEGLARLFPDLPEELDLDRDTAYRTLAAAWLEAKALASFLGKDQAEDVLRSHTEHRPLYRLVLRHDAVIAGIMEAAGLGPEAA